jgi:hypothetical protein
MNISARAAVAVLAACAAVGMDGAACSAAPLTPAQADGIEQAAAQDSVPFAIPLGGAYQALTGRTASDAGLAGALPAAPVLPPSVAAPQPHEVIPDPLVPALNTTQNTPALVARAPFAVPEDAVGDGRLGVALPSAPLKAAGAALSLGHPLQYRSAARRAVAVPAQGLQLGDLAPAVTAPQLQSAPDGQVDLQQDASHEHLTQDVNTVVNGVDTIAQGLGR